MCEECIQTAAEIDPKLIELVDSIKDELAAIHAKIAPQMREILQMVVVNAETGETPEEGDMPAEGIAEMEAIQNMFAGMMGLSYATAWFNIRQASDPLETHMMGKSIMELTLKGIEEASAYNYVVNQVKH